MTHPQPGQPGPAWPPPSRRPNAWQRLPGWQKALILVGALIPLGIIGSLAGAGEETTAGGAQDTSTADDGDAPGDGAGADPEPEAGSEAGPEPGSEARPDGRADTARDAELPDLAGFDLQAAQDSAQDAGFSVLTSHDASGRDRMQLWDRDWQVCFQTPRAGRHPTDTEVDFGVVALDEDCPPRDEGAGGPPQADEGTMPDLVGESANVARDALPDDAGITVRDVSGQDRWVLVESNWQVCAQAPAPGDPLGGEPVTLDVVKFGEPCP